jgi:hypothetical protein
VLAPEKLPGWCGLNVRTLLLAFVPGIK